MPFGSPSEHFIVPVAPAVRVENARLSFAGRDLFHDLSLTLPAGTVTALLGPSGVGKSTLLRLIAGLAHSTSQQSVGAAVFADDDKPLQNRIAWMAQQDLLLPWLSVLDNVLLGPQLRGVARRDQPVAAARTVLEEVGLAERAHDLPAKLSGGERQRAALARTLVENRPVVLMDEPFSALDAVTRLKLQNMAARLLKGRTVLLVTHDPLEALRLADQVVVMTGRPAEISAPLHPPGFSPRPPGDPALLMLQGELLERLERC